MRGFIVMAMFAVSLAQAGSKNYTEVRDLSLDAAGLTEFAVDVGAGELTITGVEGAADIVVMATITIEDADEKSAREFIEKRLRLTLERDADRARLESDFRNKWGWDSNASIDLDVHMPSDLSLRVDDGSGATTIVGVTGDLRVDDGSGSLQITNAGAVRIDDGSGWINIDGADGDVTIDDGSGVIEIRGVSGSVTIEDGSGSIRVDDVERDLIIVEDGSGSVTYTNVRGTVEQDD